ncbi:ubiquitin carboxyl-terminal hydrolase 19 [Zalerion maritima]|uniref:Ubiquitin carboxyl-terminal hydrolase 19 n=1 Tax=Zalerion maritima TaxID=339359 RepID=A0AAD5RQ20_9PEZI|nr:ubiquitin carboxyl-terminal hydrolase 19 [Zalerion maritima]
MDIQRLQAVQQSHSERIARLEKRQADDAALKSVWGQHPFPSVIGGTPQQGLLSPFRFNIVLMKAYLVAHIYLYLITEPMRRSSNEDFDDFDEQGQNLVGSLHLEADDEPVRRGVAASRANSVRFDESALQGANWGQNSRHSGDFAPIRPGSGFALSGMMERSLSHKSDGRHSSAGHSVHSIHSAPSGRASSLGLDTNFVVGSGDDESPVDIPEPPPGLMILGSAPSIIRCWLTESFGRDTLLYAAMCTGSQKSTIEHSLVKELDLSSDVVRDITGAARIRLPVYLTEAIVTQSHVKSNGNSGHHRPIPSITTSFDVVNIDQPEAPDAKKGICVVLGSDTLRAHSADLLFSRNTMTLLGDQREKLTVPFVRPEDDGVYKFLTTTNMMPGKPKLNANALPFVSSNNSSVEINGKIPSSSNKQVVEEPISPATSHLSHPETGTSNPSENGGDVEHIGGEVSSMAAKKENNSSTTSNAVPATPTGSSRRDSAAGGMWGSWRQQSINGSESSQKDGSNSSGYQQAQRSTRSMKILKPSKLSSSARTGAAYEPPPSSKTSGELRRKSTTGSLTTESPPPTPVMRWDSKDQKRASFGGGDSRPEVKAGLGAQRDFRTSLTRTANPVGGASAFKWMSSPGPGTKAPTAVAD